MSEPSDTDPAERRLVATGSRQPVWHRLPAEPPEHPDPPDPASPGPATTAAPSPPPSPSERRSRGWFQTILAGVLGAVLAVAGLQVIDDDPPPPDTEPDATTALAEASQTSAPDPAGAEVPTDSAGDPAAIGAAVIPSIVTVQVGTPTGGGLGVQGTGSGVIIDEDGYIVTNEHVISVGSSYAVITSEGRTTYEATLVGADPLTDIAVLHIEADDLSAIPYGDSDNLEVGDPAVAVGSPLGLTGGPSLTTGVISAFDRQVDVPGTDPLFGMLQTDAPITQGSSGGALVDDRGRLIGITTAVGVSNVGAEGVGFATPVELMERVVDEILETGSVDHALLGIFGTTSFSLQDDGARVASGVEITSVDPGSAADAAGLDVGDLITAVDGNELTTMEELIVRLRYRQAGEQVTLTIDDGGTPGDVELTLGSR